MSRTQHRVQLTTTERRHLTQLVRQSTVSHFTHQRARILLAAEHRPSHPVLGDDAIASAIGVSARTVARVRARWADVGVEATLRPADRGTRGRTRFAPELQARLAALACSAPPAGHARWSLHLLAEQVVLLELTPHICPETVRRLLKKTPSSPG